MNEECDPEKTGVKLRKPAGSVKEPSGPRRGTAGARPLTAPLVSRLPFCPDETRGIQQEALVIVGGLFLVPLPGQNLPAGHENSLVADPGYAVAVDPAGARAGSFEPQPATRARHGHICPVFAGG